MGLALTIYDILACGRSAMGNWGQISTARAHVARCGVLACMTLALVVLPALAADSSPEETLKSKGLTKVSNVYVLDADVKIPEWIKSTRAAKKKIEDAVRRRSNIKHDIEVAYKTLDGLAEQNEQLTARLEATDKD